MISEASRHIPDDIKAAEPSIPWRRMADFGNRLRHTYHSVDPNIVWSVTKMDLAPLRTVIEKIVRDERS